MMLKLGMDHLRHKVYKVYINNDTGLTLTYFMARSNLVKNFYCAYMSGEHFMSSCYDTFTKLI